MTLHQNGWFLVFRETGSGRLGMFLDSTKLCRDSFLVFCLK